MGPGICICTQSPGPQVAVTDCQLAALGESTLCLVFSALRPSTLISLQTAHFEKEQLDVQSELFRGMEGVNAFA